MTCADWVLLASILMMAVLLAARPKDFGWLGIRGDHQALDGWTYAFIVGVVPYLILRTCTRHLGQLAALQVEWPFFLALGAYAVASYITTKPLMLLSFGYFLAISALSLLLHFTHRTIGGGIIDVDAVAIVALGLAEKVIREKRRYPG